MTILATQFAHGGLVRGQSIGDDRVGNETLVPEQLSQQFQCRGLVPALLYQNVEDLAFLVDDLELAKLRADEAE